jgi:hypothetical protein
MGWWTETARSCSGAHSPSRELKPASRGSYWYLAAGLLVTFGRTGRGLYQSTEPAGTTHWHG